MHGRSLVFLLLVHLVGVPAAHGANTIGVKVDHQVLASGVTDVASTDHVIAGTKLESNVLGQRLFRPKSPRIPVQFVAGLCMPEPCSPVLDIVVHSALMRTIEATIFLANTAAETSTRSTLSGEPCAGVPVTDTVTTILGRRTHLVLYLNALGEALAAKNRRLHGILCSQTTDPSGSTVVQRNRVTLINHHRR
jgi:hypothetical protein